MHRACPQRVPAAHREARIGGEGTARVVHRPAWRHSPPAACALLSPTSRSTRLVSPPPTQLGEAIGEGASSVVCEAVANSSLDHPRKGEIEAGRIGSPRAGGSLAVKMVRHSETDEQEQLAMWETHVLQQLAHPHVREWEAEAVREPWTVVIE